MKGVVYCEAGGLPAEWCACYACRPEVTDAMLDGDLSVVPGTGVVLDQPSFEPVSRLFEAAFRGECASCDGDIVPGRLIARASDGSYVCRSCS